MEFIQDRYPQEDGFYLQMTLIDHPDTRVAEYRLIEIRGPYMIFHDPNNKSLACLYADDYYAKEEDNQRFLPLGKELPEKHPQEDPDGIDTGEERMGAIASDDVPF